MSSSNPHAVSLIVAFLVMLCLWSCHTRKMQGLQHRLSRLFPLESARDTKVMTLFMHALSPIANPRLRRLQRRIQLRRFVAMVAFLCVSAGAMVASLSLLGGFDARE
jgi:hypothetical protein